MKSDMRIILTKRLLREGLLQLIKTKPVSKITVTDLCNASGVNRATFYNHYETVPQILQEMMHEYAENIDGSIGLRSVSVILMKLLLNHA